MRSRISVATHWCRLIPLVILLSISTLMAWPGQALAHANLVRSLPEANSVLDTAPSELRLWFSEAPEPRFSEVQLLNSSGQRVDAVGPLHPDANDPTLLVAPLGHLSPGVYTVSWRATSADDGHITEGAFAFVVGKDQISSGSLPSTAPGATLAGGSSPTISSTVDRWVGYIAMALLTGVFAFFLFVLRPALIEAATAQPGQAPARPRTVAIPSAFLIALWLGLGLALVTTLIGAVLQAASSANVGPLDAIGSPLYTLLVHTRYGMLFWVRWLLYLLLLALLATRRSWARHASVAKQFWITGLELSALLLLTTSLSGHAAAGPDTSRTVSIGAGTSPIITTVADWLHLMAASVWIGGLIALSLALPWARQTQGVMPAFAISRMVSRFSRMATVCVVTLGLTGLFQAALDVGDWENLLDTPYGMSLLIKVVLLIPLLGLAAINLLLIGRRMVDATRAPEPNVAIQPWYRHLRQTVGGELLFVFGLLLVTSVLVNLQPAREAFGPGQVLRGGADDLRAVLVINPGRPGINTFDLYIHDKMGRAVTDAEEVAFLFSMVDRNIGETEAFADNIGGGHYLTRGGYVSMIGTWRIRVLVRRSGQDDVILALTFVPRQPSNASTVAPDVDSGALGSITLNAWWIVGGLLLLVARMADRGRRMAGRVVFAIGIMLIVIGIAVNVHSPDVHSRSGPGTPVQNNPLPGNGETHQHHVDSR